MIRPLKRTNRLKTTLHIVSCIITWLLIIIVIYVATRLLIVLNNDKKYKEYYYKSYSIEEIPQIVLDKINAITEPNVEYTRKELKKLVENNTQFNKYLYMEVGGFLDERSGLTSIPSHAIMILKRLNNVKYVKALTHEIIHLKYCTSNETFTNFMTFKYLYESDNQYLKFASREMALDILYEDYSRARQYDCGYYIIKYLKGEMNYD